MTPEDIVLEVRKMEKALIAHPEITDAAVLSEGSPEETGFQLKIFIMPSAHKREIINTITEFCHSLSIPVPFKLIFREISRTPTGKVNRKQLLSSF